MKIKIMYPAVVLHTIECEVDEEIAENVISHHQNREQFIMDKIEELAPADFDWVPNGKKGIEAALDAGYAYIKRV